MTKQTPFQKFERLAQRLVEGAFPRFFGGGLSLADIAVALAKSVDNEARGGQVPARYDIRLNPDEFERIRRAEPEVAARLTDYLLELVKQAGLTMSDRPHLTLLADPAIPQSTLTIETQSQERPSPEKTTQILPKPAETNAQVAEIAALDAYLIVDGQRHVPLYKPLISLGRAMDNDIVLDVPTVSRKHAQIRWRYGRFILYDLSNRGRTQVNNQAVSEMVLQSGDVISLSSVKLIYGEGESEPRRRSRPAGLLDDQTQIRPPAK